MVRAVNLCEIGEAPAGLVVEFSTIDDDSAYGCAVSADELCGRVRNDVSTMRKRGAEVWGCEGVVDYEGIPAA